jgi:hypothetical protein
MASPSGRRIAPPAARTTTARGPAAAPDGGTPAVPSGGRSVRARVRARRRALTAATAGLLALGLAMGTAAAAPAAPQDPSHRAVTWAADLTAVGSDDVNVRHSGGALRLADTGFATASAGTEGYGAQTLSARTVGEAVNRVAVHLDAATPGASRVEVDVRGREGSTGWTEWHRTAPGAPAELPWAVSRVQARVTLQADERGAAPALRGLRLTADAGARAKHLREATTAAFSARLFATREGLVGGTTANGHVIRPNDHFVALPSRRGLSPRDSHAYSVKVCGPARCETAPVWDVGPWNTKDDHWNTSREMWGDLPHGLPEAQAAYENGYNGGRDEFGRQVANPAGIDLADGTFYNVGLNNNGWVTVTYLWTGGGSGTSFPTWGTDVNIRQQPNTGSASVGKLAGPTTVRVECQVRGELVHYDGYSNDAWAYLPDHGGYISNIFIDVADAWLPGVPTC